MATAHFETIELECRCGCGGIPPQDFIDKLEAFRVAWGRPMHLTSAYRCPEHNQRVSNTGPNGPHTIGAVDVGLYGAPVLEFIRAAIEFGWSGIGVHQRGSVSGRFVHIDMLQTAAHPRPRVWTY